MNSKIIPYLNLTQALLVITVFAVVLFLKKTTPANKLLTAIVLVNLENELLCLLFLLHKIPTSLLMTINIILHHALWLLLLARITRIKWQHMLLPAFLLFAVVNGLFIEGIQTFNFYTFIVGAFMYIIAFIYENFVRLRDEDFDFFTGNSYVLLTAPLLFFFGISFILAFRSLPLANTRVFGNIGLYALIQMLANIIYYTLLCRYCYTEKKKQHG